MTLSMHPTSSCDQVSKTILTAVDNIYEPYRESIERQHRDVMNWADIRAGVPKVESRLQFAGSGLQLLIRFPVQLENAMKVDEQVTQAMVHLMQEDQVIKAALTAGPKIKASVRG
jgi:hypothetical protein